MGRIVAHEFMTLDGVIQGPGAPDEDREGGFDRGGWQAPYQDDETGQLVLEQYAGVDALLLGRKTYDIFAAYWPQAPAGNPFTALMNRTPKYVASRTLEHVDWENSSLLSGNVAAEVARLKERHNAIHVVGSAGLVQTLLRHGLLDRVNVWIFPVLIGTGKRLFAEGTIPAAMRVVASRTLATGAVVLTLEFAGEPAYGDMGAE